MDQFSAVPGPAVHDSMQLMYITKGGSRAPCSNRVGARKQTSRNFSCSLSRAGSGYGGSSIDIWQRGAKQETENCSLPLRPGAASALACFAMFIRPELSNEPKPNAVRCAGTFSVAPNQGCNATQFAVHRFAPMPITNLGICL